MLSNTIGMVAEVVSREALLACHPVDSGCVLEPDCEAVQAPCPLPTLLPLLLPIRGLGSVCLLPLFPTQHFRLVSQFVTGISVVFGQSTDFVSSPILE